MVLVTGSTGFIGNALIERLIKDQISVSAVARSASVKKLNLGVNPICIDTLTSHKDWGSALRKVDVLVHLAARTHILNDRSRDPLFEYRYINVDCTLNLARQAARAGVKRFIYISSAKVNGEFSILGRPFTAEDVPMPADFYGITKHEAELGLRLIAEESGMELVVIRPPLVYGPGVKANFFSMMNWLKRGIPLPFGALTENLRSFIFLDNVVDVIVACMRHPKAANQTFMVSDNKDMSTTVLLKRMGLAMGYPAKLIPVPSGLITFGTKMICRSDISDRLCGSLQVDIKKTINLLGWLPPVSVEEALIKTAKDFLNVCN